MRHRVFRSTSYSLGGLHTIMKRKHVPTGIVDIPVDQTQIMTDFAIHNDSSDMQDDVSISGLIDELDRKDVHPCIHERHYATMLQDVVMLASGASGSYEYDLTFTGNLLGYATFLFGVPASAVSDLGLFVQNLAVQGGEPAQTYIDWEALENDFMDMSKNILQKEVLLGETLAQPQIFLDAVRFLISPARGMSRLAKYAVKRYGKLVRRSSFGEVAKRVLKDAANSTLMYNFGIKPAISDLRGIEKSARVIGSRLEYLRIHRDQYVPVRVRQSAYPFEKGHAYTGEYNPAVATLYRSPSERIMHAAIGAYFRVRKDLTLEANFNAYAQYFGIGQVVGLLWELVPFSFVIDWVTNVQERIQKFSQVHTYNPFGDSQGFCASLKETTLSAARLSSGHLSLWNATIPESFSGTELGSIRHTRYTRFLNLPESRPLFDLSGVGLPQIINGGSILIQKLLKNH